MKKLFFFLALVATPILSSAGEITISYLAPASAAANLNVETIGSTTTGTSVTSSSLSFTCTSNTKLLEVMGAFRRNNGQSVTGATWTDGVTVYNLTLSTANGGSFTGFLYYLQNPTAGTGNIVITLSPSTPAMTFTAISFTGTSSAPKNPGYNPTEIVATSSATATTLVNDYLVSSLIKQDWSSSSPSIAPAGATVFQNYTFGPSGGDGGYLVASYLKAAGTSTTINYSWTTTARHQNVWNVATP